LALAQLHPAGLVVGYATLPEHAFGGALAALAATLDALGCDRAGGRAPGRW
jgi:hypothetical protein